MPGATAYALGCFVFSHNQVSRMCVSSLPSHSPAGCPCCEARHLVCFINQGCRVSPCSQNAHCPPYAPGLQAWSSPSMGQGIQQAAAVAGQWVGAGLEGVCGVGSVPAHFSWGFSS